MPRHAKTSLKGTKVFGVLFNSGGDVGRKCSECGERKHWAYRREKDRICPDCQPPEPPPPMCPGKCGKVVMDCTCTQAGMPELDNIMPAPQVHMFLNLSADRDAEWTVTREVVR